MGLAYLAETTDKSFHTPDEIRRRLGVPILGHIPFDSETPKRRGREGGKTASPTAATGLSVLHRSTSSDAEAYRSLRTALYFGAQEKDFKVIQMTSPNMGDGKSTLITNLAISMAQSGKRVLLVDADCRRPRLHRLLGLRESSVGLTAVLLGEVDLTAAIQETAVPNLSVLPCGKRPPNPAELLTSRQFESVLAELRGSYDFVLVDTPPLLAVTDPCVVAGIVDCVLLVVRISKNGRPAAEQAKEMLSSTGARLLGVVVNAIGRDGQGGLYGHRYYYDYYYKYGKNYHEDKEESVEPSPTNGRAQPK